jgi:phage gp29-like protein
MPTAVAKLNRAQMDSAKDKAMALDVIDAIQADSGVVMPEDFVVELIEATRSGTADYQVLKDSMDKAISKIILSQTMTTDDGSSNSQAQVHKGVKDDVIKADADLICESFNEIIERLVAWNFPNAKAPRIKRHTEPKADLVTQAERDNKIINLGFEPTQEYIEETYGAGWKKKETPLPPTGQLPAMGAEFAEVTALTQERIGHRQDQQSIADAAEFLSSKYKEMYGERVEKIMAFMEETDDHETVKKHLNELLAEPASEKTAEFIEKASFYSRLMGLFKSK